MTNENEKKTQERQEQVGDQQKVSPVQSLIEDLLGVVQLFHTPNRVAYCTVNVGDRFENHPIESEGFAMILARQFYLTHGAGPKKRDLKEIQDQLSWMALFDGAESPIYTRYAKVGNAIFIDLCNSSGEYVKATPDGWEINKQDINPPYFVRYAGMLPLPRPIKGGDVKDLAPFLNIRSETDFILMVGWMLGAMYPDGPFPMLTLHGPQGTGKSTTLKILRSLIDPSEAALTALPKSERDLFISAMRTWLLSFDNVSEIKPNMTDSFCRLTNEGAIRNRMLYTNSQEVILRAMRPVIFNGIPHFARQNDFIDRTIYVDQPNIPPSSRKPEQEIWTAWEKARPMILGALYNALAVALRNFDHVKLDTFPRMADFAHWVVAAEPACPWNEGVFIKAYESNRTEMIDMALDADPIGEAILKLMESHVEWINSSTELLNALKTITPDLIQKDKDWPKAPNALSNRLMRLEGFLGNKGIEISRVRQPENRLIVLKKVSLNMADERDSVPKSAIKEDAPYVQAKSPRQKAVAENEEVALEETGDDIEEGSPVGEPAEIRELTIDEEKVYEEGEV